MEAHEDLCDRRPTAKRRTKKKSNYAYSFMSIVNLQDPTYGGQKSAYSDVYNCICGDIILLPHCKDAISVTSEVLNQPAYRRKISSDKASLNLVTVIMRTIVLHPLLGIAREYLECLSSDWLQ